jgi:hypothetical protein
MSVAAQFLRRLFDKGQTARSRGQSEAIRLRLTPAQCPAYFAMRSLEQAQEFRAELNVAARCGAIHIATAPRLKEPRDVDAIVLRDLAALAVHLGLELRSEAVATASERLRDATAEFAVLTRVLERWNAGQPVRHAGPAAAADLIDAVKVIRARRDATEDVLLRRESIRLFADSKRIAAIAPWIDVLLSEQLQSSVADAREVLASLGLLHEPQPWLVAGHGVVKVSGQPVPLAAPYLGLPAEAVEAFSFPSPPRAVLTIENKQTFHEAARAARDAAILVIYTAGMPSPAWRAAYGRALDAVTALGAGTAVYHFGDLDVGGLRIAATVSRAAREHGCRIVPWQMAPSDYLAQTVSLKPVASAVAQEMVRWALAADWNTLASAITANPGAAEQEALQVKLP